jgi:6-pyruvoyltetrahydropterin/6-carboxytetrahydropterin synthase
MLRSVVLFTVSVGSRFWATHGLTLSEGSKEPVHGHNWSVTAEVRSDTLNSMGIIMDFRHLKQLIGEIAADFGNVPLEQLSYFQRNNPSAENIAKYIFEKLEPGLPEDVTLSHVSVTEEPGCSAKFSK